MLSLYIGYFVLTVARSEYPVRNKQNNNKLFQALSILQGGWSINFSCSCASRSFANQRSQRDAYYNEIIMCSNVCSLQYGRCVSLGANHLQWMTNIVAEDYEIIRNKQWDGWVHQIVGELDDFAAFNRQQIQLAIDKWYCVQEINEQVTRVNIVCKCRFSY